MPILERRARFFPRKSAEDFAVERDLLRTADRAAEHSAVVNSATIEYTVYRNMAAHAFEKPMSRIHPPCFAKQLYSNEMCSPVHDDLISRSAGNGTMALGLEIVQ